jgi:hypothetical protein
MTNQALNVVDCATLTVSSTSIGLVSASPALINGQVSGKTVRRAVISCTVDDVMWRADGTAPTDTVGHPLDKGGSMSLTGANYKSLLGALRFIRVTTDATLFITYFD